MVLPIAPAKSRQRSCDVAHGGVARPRAATQGRVVSDRSTLLAAIARRNLLLGAVFRGALLDHLAHQVAIAGHVRREGLETLAVPFLELDHAGSLVIEAARLDRREHARGAELLDARLRQIQMLQAPAHLLGRHDLTLAVLLLRGANRVDDDDSVDDSARMVDVALARWILEVPLARGVE